MAIKVCHVAVVQMAAARCQMPRHGYGNPLERLQKTGLPTHITHTYIHTYVYID